MLAAATPVTARAHGDNKHDEPSRAPPRSNAGAAEPTRIPDARAYFTDTELVSHKGRKTRFFSDALDGRTVLINVIYTDCKDACPLITQQLKAVRKQLGTRARDIHFVSISADPVNDTPKALERFARDQGVDEPNWTFLTGDADKVAHVLKKLGQFSAEPQSHSTVLIAGNVPTKRWSKLRADAPIEAITQRLLLVLDGSDAGTSPAARR